MLSQKLLKSAVLGALSTITGWIITTILVALQIGQHPTYELNSLMVTINRPSFMVGLIVNFIAGGFVALLLCLLFEKLGPVYMITWSVCGGLAIWLIFEIFFTAVIEGKSIPIRPLSDYFVHLAGTICFGISLGMFFKYILYK